MSRKVRGLQSLPKMFMYLIWITVNMPIGLTEEMIICDSIYNMDHSRLYHIIFPKDQKKKKDLHDTRRLANQLGVSCQWLIYSTSNMCIIFCFAIGCLVGGGEKEKKKDGTSSLHETGSKDWNIGVILYLSGILIIKKMIRFCMNLNYTYLKRK